MGKTRSLAKGLKRITVNQRFKEFNVNDKVLIRLKPKNKITIPHAKFNRKHGVIVGKKGQAYIVKIKDGNKDKTVDVLPVHLETTI